MSHTMPIEQLEKRLANLISTLSPGDEITLTAGNLPVAKIIPQSSPRRRQFGTLKGMLTVVEEDDEHLAGFKEYME